MIIRIISILPFIQITLVYIKLGYIFRHLSGVVTRTAGTVMSTRNAKTTQFKMCIKIPVTCMQKYLHCTKLK